MAIQIDSTQILDNAITTAKIGSGQVTPALCDLSTAWGFTAVPTVNADPSSANELARKSYVDGIAAGLFWKDAVRVKVDSNVDLSSPGSSLDDVGLSTGDRVLLTGQTADSQDGIYEWNGASEAMSRASDADAFAELDHAAVFIKEGTYADTGWIQSASLSSYSSQNWVQFSGTGGGRTAGNGLALTGNALSVNPDGTTLAVGGSGVKVNTGGISNNEISATAGIEVSKLAASAVTVSAGTGLSGGGSVSLGGTTTLNVSNITNAMIDASAAIADTKLAAISTSGKVQGSALQLAANSGLQNAAGGGIELKASTAGTGLTLTSSGGDQVLAVGGLTDGQIASGAAIDVSKLATNSLTVTAGTGLSGGGSVSLGGSTTLNVSGLTDSEIAAGAAISDAKLAQITTADKVASSAIQLATNSALNSNTGLELKSSLAGTGLTMASSGGNQVINVTALTDDEIAAGASIATSKLASNQVTVTAGTALSGGGAVTLGGSVTLNVDEVGENQIADAAVTNLKIGVTFRQKVFSNHSSATCTLDSPTTTGNAKAVIVFRNGLAIENCSATGGSASTVDQFTVAPGDESTDASVTLGAAPSSDTIMVWYF